MNRRQKIIVSVTGIFLVLLLLVGLTYAYFLTQITGNNNSKSLSVTTANLALVYGDGNGIIAPDSAILPGDTLDSKTFTVTNEGNATTDYVVVIEDVSVTDVSTGDATTFESNDFVYTLTCVNEDGTDCTNQIKNETTFPINGGVIVGNSIEVDGIQTYTLTVTYKETGLDQSNDMNKSLTAKVNIRNITEVNPYSSDTTLLAYNIINNAMSVTTSEKEAGYAELRTTPLTTPALSASTLYNEVGEEATSESDISISTTYQKYYWTYGTGYTIDPVTGKFTLTGVSTCKYNDGSCHETLVGKYIISISASSNSSSTNTQKITTDVTAIYKVTTAPASSTTGITMKVKSINKTYYNAENTLSITPDEYGTSYYFRGAVKNNYLSFNNMCWRIVRIEGDGAIKIVLADDEAGCSTATLEKEDSAFIGNTKYYDSVANYENSDIKKAFNVFLKGGSFSSYNTETSTNETLTYTAWSSTALAKLKSETICLGETTTKYDFDTGNIMTQEDLDKQSENYGYNLWMYDIYKRLSKDGIASLICHANGGRTSSIQIYPLTADEVAFAGGSVIASNNTYYLIENALNEWWTITPAAFDSSYETILGVEDNGRIKEIILLFQTSNLRPAVSLIAGTTIASGDGTITNPYIVE